MHTHLDAGQEHTGNFAASLAEAVVLGISTADADVPMILAQALVINHPEQTALTMCDALLSIYGLADRMGLVYGRDVVDLAQTIARHAIPRGGRIATLFDQQFPPCAAVDVISAMDDEKIALYLYSIACVSFTLFAAQRQLSLAKN